MYNNPFVPNEKAVGVFINSDYAYLFDNSKIGVVSVFGADILPRYIRNHPDINLFSGYYQLFLSKTCVLHDPIGLAKDKKSSEVELSNTHRGYNKLNAFILSDTIFGNLEVLDKNLVLQYKNAVHTKQTYAKCSTALINDKAAITDDTSVFKAIKSAGFDALLIEKGDIKLDTKDYGFIGGSCGLISPNLLAFAGDCATHRDYIAIKDFARNHNCYLEILCKGELLDIGGIIPIF